MSEAEGLETLLAAVSAGGDWGTLTLLRTHVGSTYDGQLLVVGRATNGWRGGFTHADLASGPARAAVIAKAPVLPMSWVGDKWRAPRGTYATGRSPFWRVVRRVAEGLSIRGLDWSDRLCWTNLYRVAPSLAGNPSDALCAAQMSAGARLLRDDLDRLRPRRMLVLAGENWFRPFAAALGCSLTPVNEAGVDGVGRVGACRVVVARHPQGKPEAAMAARILVAFARPVDP